MAGVDHRHEWVRDADQPAYPARYSCSQCPEVTVGCQDCAWPLDSSLTICGRCLSRARDLVEDVREALALIPDPFATILGVRGSGLDRPRVARQVDQLPFGLGATIDDPEISGIRRPDSLLEVLEDVALDWAEHRAGIRGRDGIGVGAEGDYASSVDAPVGSAVFGWLREHMLWAAQSHPAWTEQLRLLRQVRRRARELAGMTPVREPVPCVHCGGIVVQEWTAEGLADVRRCRKCKAWWPNGERLSFANRTALLDLPRTHADALVTADDALRVLPDLRRNTLTQVLARDERRAQQGKERRLPERGRDVRGQVLYRLGDVAALLPAPPSEHASAPARAEGA